MDRKKVVKDAQSNKPTRSRQVDPIHKNSTFNDDDPVPISDQESGQEGDFEEDTNSNQYNADSVRAQYNNQSPKMSHLSILNSQ